MLFIFRLTIASPNIKMKISSFPYTYDKKSKSCPSFKSFPQHPKYFPEIMAKIAKVGGEYISMPEQRLFLAATALFLQPLIDLKFASEDKKVDSAIKSASKAMVGGCTGVAIRSLFIRLTTKSIAPLKDTFLYRYFLPDKIQKMFEFEPLMAKKLLKQYNASLGSIFAIAFMVLFSNSNIDAPLTGDVQDLLSGVIKENKTWEDSFKTVLRSRCRKVRIWFKHKKDFVLKICEKLRKISEILKEDEPNKKNGGTK